MAGSPEDMDDGWGWRERLEAVTCFWHHAGTWYNGIFYELLDLEFLKLHVNQMIPFSSLKSKAVDVVLKGSLYYARGD